MMVNETKGKAGMRDLAKSHRPHLPSLSISTRLFCPGNARIELPAEEAIPPPRGYGGGGGRRGHSPNTNQI